jgi:hypothetical protein
MLPAGSSIAYSLAFSCTDALVLAAVEGAAVPPSPHGLLPNASAVVVHAVPAPTVTGDAAVVFPPTIVVKIFDVPGVTFRTLSAEASDTIRFPDASTHTLWAPSIGSAVATDVPVSVSLGTVRAPVPATV